MKILHWISAWPSEWLWRCWHVWKCEGSDRMRIWNSNWPNGPWNCGLYPPLFISLCFIFENCSNKSLGFGWTENVTHRIKLDFFWFNFDMIFSKHICITKMFFIFLKLQGFHLALKYNHHQYLNKLGSSIFEKNNVLLWKERIWVIAPYLVSTVKSKAHWTTNLIVTAAVLHF